MLANRTLQSASTYGGYQIKRSLRTRGAYPTAPTYFSRTQGVPTSTTRFTWSAWVKRGVLGVGQFLLNSGAGTSSSEDALWFSATDRLVFSTANASAVYIQTSAQFRDPSAWLHIVMIYDSAQASGIDRLKIFVNGVLQTFVAGASYLSPSQTTYLADNGALLRMGSRTYLVDEGFDGYWAEVNFVDGQALTPTSFGQTDPVTGVWSAKRYTGTYGNNGFYLDFSDNSSLTTASNVGLGRDGSGNGNYWVTNSISLTPGATYDSMLDVPLGSGGNERGNYCTFNPLDKGANFTIVDGNLFANQSAATYQSFRGTIGVTSGKWYWEATSGNQNLGIATSAAFLGPNQALGGDAFGWGYSSGGTKNNNALNPAYGATYTTTDIIGVALDADAGTLTFYKNGTTQGQAYSGLTSGPYFPAFCGINSAPNWTGNFGQRPFTYTPPTGFKALHTGNLPDPTIRKPNQYFDTTAYSGTSATQTIINSGAMQPDLVWIKHRSDTSHHRLQDSVRGIAQVLFSSLTNAEYTSPGGDGVTTINSNGFTLGAGTNVYNYNNTSQTYVAWQWKAGGTAVTNNTGSISAQVSANLISGFSIVSCNTSSAVSTIGHGLGVVPKMIIGVNRAAPNGWWIYHTGLTSAAYYISLNATIPQTLNNAVWASTAPTNLVFTQGSGAWNNGASAIFYCFAEVAGFSKFGSYTGSGNTDGPFIYCGFRPGFVIVRRIDTADGWIIYDTQRSPINQTILGLQPNSSIAEYTETNNPIDILSSGFKLRGTGTSSNLNTASYIFIAFAEVPFKNALAR